MASSKGEWMVETLKRLQLDDLDEPMIARPPPPVEGEPEMSPEICRLAEQVVEASRRRNAELAAMAPKERRRAIAEWARKLATDSVAAGERNP